MIMKEKLVEFLEQLRKVLGTKEGLLENEEGIIKQLGSVEDLLDTVEESFRIYMLEMRAYKDVK